jgi:SAM-dependent methyltransferase
LDLQGWSAHPVLYERLLNQTNASFVIEVGVWKGTSSILFAKWLKIHGRGVVACVDTFTGSLEHWLRSDAGEIGGDLKMPMRHGRPALFHQFWSNVRHEQVEQYIVPFPVTSRVAADYFAAKKLQADLIHVDAGHAYEDAKQDLRMWYNIVRPGGCLLADDYTAGWPGVVKAVDEFVVEERLALHKDGTKAWFCKPTTATVAGLSVAG